MRKIPTLFIRDPATNLRHVLREVHPDCQWVLDGEGRATRKFDGTCTRLDEHGAWWARREVKPGGAIPAWFVPVQRDEVTGKTVGWEPVEQSAFAKAFTTVTNVPTEPGTYELCGPKINGNPENFDEHHLIRHAGWNLDAPRDFDGLAAFLNDHALELEGIVWHHPDGRMAKLKVKDFPHA